ncbi:hypothetical protein P7K49_039563, partial [Saguinus oedipus]
LGSEQPTAPAKTTAIRLMVLFCLGIFSLASFLSPQEAALPSRSCKHQSEGETVPLTCTKSCSNEAMTKPLRQPQKSCWRPTGLLHWKSSGPWATKFPLNMWCAHVFRAFTGSYNPEL